MLDVHPPHEAAHTWKDFFIHIATICIGLLIAVGLEQSVEALHRQHERAELRESLRRESEQIVRDCERMEATIATEIQWHQQVEGLLLASAHEHRPIGATPPMYQASAFDVPVDSVYLAAKASNQRDLLSQQEVQAYGELDSVVDDVRLMDQRHGDALAQESESWHTLPISTANVAVDLTHYLPIQQLQNASLTPAQLDETYKDAVRVSISSAKLLYFTRSARGAATAMLKGKRDLRDIQAAEHQFDQ